MGMILCPADTERLSSRLDRAFDVFLGVGRGDERSLELAARQVNPASEHFPEVAPEEARVAASGAIVVAHGAVVEEERDHAADALNDVRDPSVRGGAIEALGQPG